MSAARLIVGFIRLHWLALCVTAGLVSLYALGGFWLAPRVARAQLEEHVAQTLHRKISVGEIRFNPFTFEVTIGDFSLQEADGAPLVAFRRLYINAELASLLQRAVVLKAVQLEAPRIDVVVARDGSVNLANLVPPSDPQAAKEPPPRVHIGKLEVTEGRLGLADYTHARPFTAGVTPIKFTLTDFKTDVGYENAYDFAGTTTSGERLEWNGVFTVDPLGSTGRFSVTGLKMKTADSYARESLPFRLVAGEATLQGDYRFTFNPAFALDVNLPTMQVRELALAEDGSTASPPIVVGGIDVQDVAFSYGKRDLGMKRIEVRGARVDAARASDGTLSLMRLFGGGTATDQRTAASSRATNEAAGTKVSTVTPVEKSGAWRMHVDEIRLADAAVRLEDRGVSPAARFQLSPVQLTVRGWSTDPAAELQVDADVGLDKGGRFLAKGSARLQPLSTEISVDLTGVDLPMLQTYLESTTALTLQSGKLAVKGKLSYGATPESAPPMKFAGEIQVNDLRTTDRLVNQDFVKWRALTISGIELSRNPGRLGIERVVARQPYASVVIAQDTSLNVTSVLNPAASAPAAAGKADAVSGTEVATGSGAPGMDEAKAEGRDRSRTKVKAEAGTRLEAQTKSKADAGTVAKADATTGPAANFPVRIKSVEVIDGSANFADYSIEPSFATGILDLNGKVVGLSSDPASRAEVKLEGKVDRYAPVDITGTVNLLSAAAFTDLSMNFRNVELTTFNPYSGKFAGYSIAKGKLSTELKYKVENRKLDAAHHIVLDNLEFGAKTDSKDAAPIPIKIAVALLKDRQGIIDLNLPVGGTLDDPKFRLGPIIWKALLGLLTKIVTAPFAALGALFGGGEELAYVDFPVGSAMLGAAELEKLTQLAKALGERPQLKLDLPLTVVTARDSDAMARAALAAKVPEQEPDAAAKRRVSAYEKVYKEVMKAAPQYPPETKTDKGADPEAQLKFLESALLRQLKPDDAALTALAQQRARAVQDALLANPELSPERVFITAERVEGNAQAETVRMEMKLR